MPHVFSMAALRGSSGNTQLLFRGPLGEEGLFGPRRVARTPKQNGLVALRSQERSSDRSIDCFYGRGSPLPNHPPNTLKGRLFQKPLRGRDCKLLKLEQWKPRFEASRNIRF